MKPLEEHLGYKFRNSLLLAEALTHPSLAYETLRPHFDNQRLEFLGDAVLQLTLTDHIFSTCPALSEGDMTKMRSRMVSKEALHKFAIKLNLGEFVMLGKGEESNGGRDRASTLADAFEALIGAVYIDGGYQAAYTVIIKAVESELDNLNECLDEKNPKGKLQEILQALIPVSPEYKLVKESGPDHLKEFQVAITWCGESLGEGVGSSKKHAEAEAAREALGKKCWSSCDIEALKSTQS